MAQHSAYRESPGCSTWREKQEEASGLPELKIWGCKFSFIPSMGEQAAFTRKSNREERCPGRGLWRSAEGPGALRLQLNMDQHVYEKKMSKAEENKKHTKQQEKTPGAHMGQENCMFPTARVGKPCNSWGFGQWTQTNFALIMGQMALK